MYAFVESPATSGSPACWYPNTIDVYILQIWCWKEAIPAYCPSGSNLNGILEPTNPEGAWCITA